jgi:hypothetical protein
MKYLFYIIFFILLSNTISAQRIGLKKISAKWIGKYSFSLNSNNEDWRDEHIFTLKIYRDSIIYESEGYQLYEKHLLDVIENDNKLIFMFKKSLDNTFSEVFLKKTKDFGVLSFNKKKYFWNCPYISTRFKNGKKINFILIKTSLLNKPL